MQNTAKSDLQYPLNNNTGKSVYFIDGFLYGIQYCTVYNVQFRPRFSTVNYSTYMYICTTKYRVIRT